MVTSPQIANDIAASVLSHPSFQAAALLLRETEGHFNQYGEPVEGAAIETAVSLVHAPISGQQRLTLEEGLRDEDVRTFWLLGDHPSLRYGLTDGDRFVLGALGTGQNRFDGATREIAERARDTYAANNPTWLAAYQTTTTNAIQLRGFGHPVYQRYDANGRALGERRPIPRNAGEPLGRVYGSNGRAARSGETRKMQKQSTPKEISAAFYELIHNTPREVIAEMDARLKELRRRDSFSCCLMHKRCG